MCWTRKRNTGRKVLWIVVPFFSMRCILGLLLCSAVASRPNVVFVVSDDLGFNDVGFHGSEIETPFLDSLAMGEHSVHLDQYYGQSICTPSRAAMLTGRYASHTGMQHSYWIQGEAGGLPLRFRTIGDHFRSAGYATAMVGKWHLGFESWDYTPIGRGFDSYYGYLGGGEDYLTHKSGAFVDLTANKSGVLDAGGLYSTELFANASINRIVAHAAAASPKPLFLYIAMQAVHSPLEAPAEWVAKYDWIKDSHRRTLAAMTSCLDAQLKRVAEALQTASMWENSVFVFVADVSLPSLPSLLSFPLLVCLLACFPLCVRVVLSFSLAHTPRVLLLAFWARWAQQNGGPPYVANSNWPMRGGKWTSWEGGTHLTGFVHAPTALPAPPRNFSGLMHQCDWVPTLLGAAGVTSLNDTASPPMDGINLWPYLSDPANTTGTRTSVLLNVDPTNQGQLNDPHGWSGYAGIRVGEYKLVLGDPGVPNSWCWPNQNSSEVAASPPLHPLKPRSPFARPADGGRLEGRAFATARADCTVTNGVCFPGADISHAPAPSPAACCDACWAEPNCRAWTYHPNDTDSGCWLKTAAATPPKKDTGCVSGTMDARPPAPAPAPGDCPATEYSACTCSYNGTVPNNRKAPLLFHLGTDPTERVNLAALPEHSAALAELMAQLQVYVDSALTPLNINASERRAAPESNPAEQNRTWWAPWDDSAGRHQEL